MKSRSSTDGPKRRKTDPIEKSSGGFFDGIRAFFIETGISRRRLQVWRARFADLGGTILKEPKDFLEEYDRIYVLAADQSALSKELDLGKFGGMRNLEFVQYSWVEECLKNGELISCEPFCLVELQIHMSTVIEENEQALPKQTTKQCNTAAESSLTVAGNETPISVQGVHEMGKDKSIMTENIDDQGHKVNLEDDMPNFNKHVTGPLSELSQIYADVFADEWRALTYRKVANKLDKLPYRISSTDELKGIQGIGKAMILKIKEILCTGKLKKLENLKSNFQVQTMQQFAGVWGIGPKYAKQLYQAGYKTLQDLTQHPSLPSMARIGLKYHHDIILRIPRLEVTEAGAFVQQVLEDLCPGAWLTIGGSYRRGQATCGDIDLLITHPDGHSHEDLMRRLIRKLVDLEFLTECQIPLTENRMHKVETFMGICKLPQYIHHRRIDIKIYPKEIYAFALVYFTGNDVLNRRIRYLARTKGYKLSDQGLFVRVGNQKDTKASEVSIQCETEEEIFEKLGLPFPEPNERNW